MQVYNGEEECGAHTSDPGASAEIRINCTQRGLFQYVMISLPRAGQMTLCEVMVGALLPTTPNPVPTEVATKELTPAAEL